MIWLSILQDTLYRTTSQKTRWPTFIDWLGSGWLKLDLASNIQIFYFSNILNSLCVGRVILYLFIMQLKDYHRTVLETFSGSHRVEQKYK